MATMTLEDFAAIRDEVEVNRPETVDRLAVLSRLNPLVRYAEDARKHKTYATPEEALGVIEFALTDVISRLSKASEIT